MYAKGKVVVRRLESGNRTEYLFKSLKEALAFIQLSEHAPELIKDISDNSSDIDGAYEIYMPRSYSK